MLLGIDPLWLILLQVLLVALALFVVWFDDIAAHRAYSIAIGVLLLAELAFWTLVALEDELDVALGGTVFLIVPTVVLLLFARSRRRHPDPPWPVTRRP